MNLAGLFRSFAVGILIVGAGVAVRADEDGGSPGRRAGILPLVDVLARIAETYRGHVLKVELENEDGDAHGTAGSPPVYEIKLLTPSGDVLKLYVDARTAEVLNVKGRQRGRDSDRD